MRGPLASLLAGQRPNWTTKFIEFAANSGPELRATALLFATLNHKGVRVSQESQASLIGRLVEGNLQRDAWSYYQLIRPGVDAISSRDPRFTATKSSPTVFDWNAVAAGGIFTSIQPNATGGTFDFSVPPGEGGPLLQQVQMFPAGRYRLTGHSRDIDQLSTSSPYWVLICSGRELGRIPVPNSAHSHGIFSGDFVVPGDCIAQMFVMVARPSEKTTGVTGQIDSVRLERIGG